MEKVNLDKKRKLLKRMPIDTLSVYDFEGSIDHVIKFLSSVEVKAIGRGFSNVQMEIVHSYEQDNAYVELIGDRLETDKEVWNRLKWEKKNRENSKKLKEKQRVNELATLERLAKKYKMELKEESEKKDVR